MGASVDFENSSGSEYIDVGSPMDGETAITMAAWAKFESFTTRVALAGSRAAGNVGCVFALNDGSTFFVGSNAKFIKYTNTFSTGVWYHFAWTYSGGALLSNSNVYEDGVSQSLVDHFQGTLDPGTMDTSSGTLKIGWRNQTAGVDDMDGLIAHFHTYNRALSEEEVQEIMYNPTAVVNGLESYHPLIGPSATYVNDFSGNGFDGTATGTAASDDGPPVYFPQMVTA